MEFAYKNMKKLVLSFALAVFFSLVCFSQEDGNLRKVDEFGVINQEDLSARLDIFTQELKLAPTLKAYIIVYKGEKNSAASVYKRSALIKQYFKNAYNFDLSRIIVDTGKIDTEEKVELYVTNNPPSAVDVVHLPEIDSSKTSLFGNLSYDLPAEEYECCLPGKYAKPMAQASLKVFSELLKKHPDSKAYLVSYLYRFYLNGYGKLDPPDLANKMLREYKNELIKNGVSPARIVEVKGGYRKDFRQVDVWFVPKGSSIPVPKPNYFPKIKTPNRK